MPLSCELVALFRACFPFAVRSEETTCALLSNPENRVFLRRDGSGRLIGASVVHKNAVLLLCVDSSHRRQGIGDALLAETEQSLRALGYSEIVVGVGDDYLLPGVPTPVMPSPQALRPARLYPELTDDAATFFRKRGYEHSWGADNCFDMRLSLADLPPIENNPGDTIDGVTYRWGEPSDLAAVCACTDDAEKDFTPYYVNPALYRPDSRERALLAVQDGCVCGTLIVANEGEAPGLGSVGCTTVRTAFRGRHIAVNLVRLGTKHLKSLGLPDAFLGYTYSGLDQLYSYAGYRICVYYFMARKSLA